MYTQIPAEQINAAVSHEGMRLQTLLDELHKVVIGQHVVLEQIVIALIANGHILLEGVPGVAKTTMIKTLARTLGLSFNRIQFTPDLLPADVIGTLIFNPQTREFETKKGPLFANIILADEINRAPAKVQSALLEAMQEHQVTIGSTTFILDEPFIVFATQNPVEQEGTYRLPEAQVDRFMMKVHVEYPTATEEKLIIQRSKHLDTVTQLFDHAALRELQNLVSNVYVDEKIIDYIVALVCATRNPKLVGHDAAGSWISCGASPRATRALFQAARAHALLRRRSFVVPDDVKAVCNPVLRHRITLSYDAEADGVNTDHIIAELLAKIPTP